MTTEQIEATSYRAELATRAADRRRLYRADPLWRLTKLKANRETRRRQKLRGGVQARSV